MMHVYVGTYTGSGSEGIYVLEWDGATGTLSDTGLRAQMENPSFLCLHPEGGHLYAVSELGNFEGRPTGAVYAFCVDRESRALTALNGRPSEGTYPCHLAVNGEGSVLAVANYGSGTLAVFPLGRDGAIGKVSQVIQHQGSGPNSERQEGPHAHSVTFSRDGRFLYACDLGVDKVMIYKVNARDAVLEQAVPAWVLLPPCSGPRHFAWHPEAPLAFVIHELDNQVTSFKCLDEGRLEKVDTVSTLPASWDGPSSCADIHVHPSGRFVYGSNRGADSIAAYAVDSTSGRMTPLGQFPSGGKNPRNFALSPCGGFLLAANQDSDNIVVFRVDRERGILARTERSFQIPKPVCLAFAER